MHYRAQYFESLAVFYHPFVVVARPKKQHINDTKQKYPMLTANGLSNRGQQANGKESRAIGWHGAEMILPLGTSGQIGEGNRDDEGSSHTQKKKESFLNDVHPANRFQGQIWHASPLVPF